jgi:hypothetical protein
VTYANPGFKDAVNEIRYGIVGSESELHNGSVTVKVVPLPPGLLFALTAPACDEMMDLEMNSPSPVP